MKSEPHEISEECKNPCQTCTDIDCRYNPNSQKEKQKILRLQKRIQMAEEFIKNHGCEELYKIFLEDYDK